ncbi:TPA: fimbrial protein [Citrobacter freundii]|nr:fimbrial protein [Citrobacter freundii]
MNFKATLCATLLPVLLAGSVSAFAEEEEPVAPTAVTVPGGQISFTGEVIAAPCAVDNDSANQVVKLGQVSTNVFSDVGSTSGAVPFSIKLTGCDLSGTDGSANYTKAAITFNGQTVAGNNKALAVSSGGGVANSTAGNIGVQIQQDGAAVVVDGAGSSTAKAIAAGSNEMFFDAAYVATAKNVTAGVANATADFTVTYE